MTVRAPSAPKIPMSDRAARWIVWSGVAVSFTLGSLGVVLQALTGRTSFNLGLPLIIALVLFSATWAITGAVVVTKRPRHPAGWLLVAMVAYVGPQMLAFGLLAYSMESGSAGFPGFDLAVIGLAWTGQPFFFLSLTMLLLIYPSGRLLTRRWAIVGWLGLVGMVGYLVVVPLQPRVVDFGIGLTSPWALPQDRWRPLQPLLLFFLGLSIASLIGAAVSLILRFRHSIGVERQQLKWFLYPATTVILTLSAVALIPLESDLSTPLLVLITLSLLSALGMAFALAVAILRYRLYDIDVIVNRSLVYGALTVTLAAVYLVSVTLIGNLIRITIGQESPIAIVASTLIVWVLFHPLRSRLQSFINRRFYRTSYDAARTLDQFGSTLAETMDAEAQVGLLLDVIEEVFQPAHVSLWMRSRTRSS